MKVLIVLLCLLFIVALPILTRRQGKNRARTSKAKADKPKADESQQDTSTDNSAATATPSCGLGDRCTLSCEQELLIDAPEYYDDEELDAYRGTPADKYTPSQIEQFEDVLTTMQPREVHGWLLSLQKRGIELPNALKDEAFLLING